MLLKHYFSPSSNICNLMSLMNSHPSQGNELFPWFQIRRDEVLNQYQLIRGLNDPFKTVSICTRAINDAGLKWVLNNCKIPVMLLLLTIIELS